MEGIVPQHPSQAVRATTSKSLWFRWIVAAAIGALLVALAVWFCCFRITRKHLPAKNPTGFIFDASVPLVQAAIRLVFTDGFRGMNVAFREENNPFAKALNRLGNENDAYAYNHHMPIGKSDVYYARGEPLEYLAEFQIHLTALDDGKTRVEIVTYGPQVICGKTLGGHGLGLANDYRSVDATTIEEYELLVRIGAALEVRNMPELRRPQ